MVVAHCVGGLAVHIALMGGHVSATHIASMSCTNSSMFFKLNDSSMFKLWLSLVPLLSLSLSLSLSRSLYIYIYIYTELDRHKVATLCWDRSEKQSVLSSERQEVGMSKNDDNVKIANILDACLVVLILFFLSLCLNMLSQ
jgi:hypothetical protein